ncbi:MAG: SDR family oxidoreductase [Acholeplasmataceae bacterium]|nr:SDR family oxidoreductase [Acholeplasmataceae bacterium]
MKRSDQVVVVTGASSGIGLETASLLSSKGMKVYGLSRSKPRGKYSFNHLIADVTSIETLQKAADFIRESQGGIDVLVNCAGIGIGGAVEETDEADYDNLFNVNVKGVFQTTKVFLPLLREGKGKKIINIGSIAGILPIPFQTFYSMSKAAIQSFSEALRNELRPFGIEVTTVLPGDTKTAFTSNRKNNPISEESPYAERQARSLKKMEIDEQTGKSPISVANVIFKLINRRRLPVQVAIGFEYKLFVFLNRILPKRLVNWILYQIYGK